MKYVLAVDVGNSRAKFGLFEAGSARFPQPLAITAVQLNDDRNVPEALCEWIPDDLSRNLATALVAGSNPTVRDHLLNHWPWKQPAPVLVESYLDIPLQVDLEMPETVGIDRLLSAYAALGFLPSEHSVIVVDSGTATTVNLTTGEGTFRGGAILPGLRLSAHALHDYTARLPLIDADQLRQPSGITDAPLPGRNTEDAMKAGLFWGQLGAVREITSRLTKVAVTRFESPEPSLLLTGGGGRQLAGYLPGSVCIDSLALHGLARLARKLPHT